MKRGALAIVLLSLAAAAPAGALMPIEMPRNADGGPRFVDPDERVFGNGVFGVADSDVSRASENRDQVPLAAQRGRSAWRQAYAALSAAPSPHTTVDCLNCTHDFSADPSPLK
jgi:hypothetical protein